MTLTLLTLMTFLNMYIECHIKENMKFSVYLFKMLTAKFGVMKCSPYLSYAKNKFVFVN